MRQNQFSTRNPAIDILRALTMMLMVFVNDLWTIKGYPAWMGHAAFDQDFLGLSDIVFPCFLFVVGMSIPYAIENAFVKGQTGIQIVGHILSRSFALIVMGIFLVNTEGGLSPEVGMNRSVYKLLLMAAFFLIWNQYPKKAIADGKSNYRRWLYPLLKMVGVALLVFLGIIFIDKGGNTLRPKWWGILGLIGWSYLLCAFIYLFSRDKIKYLVAIWALFLVWNMLRCNLRLDGVPALNLPQGNALEAITGIVHLDNGAHQALVMGGVILSVLEIKAKKSARVLDKYLLFGLLTLFLVILGIITNRLWIISKLQATAPWVFFSSAIAVGVYGVLVWLCSLGKQKWFSPIYPAGAATLTCYMAPHIIYAILNLIGIGTARPDWMNSGLLGLLSCLAFSFLCIGLTWLLNKVSVKLKV